MDVCITNRRCDEHDLGVEMRKDGHGDCTRGACGENTTSRG